MITSVKDKDVLFEAKQANEHEKTQFELFYIALDDHFRGTGCKKKSKNLVGNFFILCEKDNENNVYENLSNLVEFLNSKFSVEKERSYFVTIKIVNIIIELLLILIRQKPFSENFIHGQNKNLLDNILLLFANAFNYVITCAAQKQSVKRNEEISKILKLELGLLDKPTLNISKLLLPYTIPSNTNSPYIVLFSICLANFAKYKIDIPNNLFEEYKNNLLKIVSNIITSSDTVGIYEVCLINDFLSLLITNEKDLEEIIAAISRAILRKAQPTLNIIKSILSSSLNKDLLYHLVNKILKPILKAYSLFSDGETKRLFASVIADISLNIDNPKKNHSIIDIILEYIESIPVSSAEVRTTCIDVLSSINSDNKNSRKIIEYCMNISKKRESSHSVRCAVACCMASKINTLSENVCENQEFFNKLSNWLKTEIVSTDPDIRFLVYLFLSQVEDVSFIKLIISKIKIKTTSIIDQIIKVVNLAKTGKTGLLDPTSPVSYHDLLFGLDILFNALSFEVKIKSNNDIPPNVIDEVKKVIKSSGNQLFLNRYYTKCLKSKVECDVFSRVILNILLSNDIYKLSNYYLLEDENAEFLKTIGDTFIYVTYALPYNYAKDTFFRYCYEKIFTTDNDNIANNHTVIANKLAKISFAFSLGFEHMFLTDPNFAIPSETESTSLHYKDKFVHCSTNKYSKIDKIVKFIFSFIAKLSYELTKGNSFDFSYNTMYAIEHMLIRWVITLSHKIIIDYHGQCYWANNCFSIPGIDLKDLLSRNSSHIVKYLFNLISKIDFSTKISDSKINSALIYTATNAISNISSVEALTPMSVVFDILLELINNKIDICSIAKEVSSIQNSTKSNSINVKSHKSNTQINTGAGRKKFETSAKLPKKKNADEQKTNSTDNKNTIDLDMHIKRMNTSILFLNSIINGVKLSNVQFHEYSLEPYIYPIFKTSIFEILCKLNDNVPNVKENACNDVSFHFDYKKVLELLKNIIELFMKNCDLCPIAKPYPIFLHTILHFNDIPHFIYEQFDQKIPSKYELLNNVLDAFQKISLKNMQFMTTPQFILFIFLIKSLITKIDTSKNLDIISNNAIQTISKLICINVTLSSSPFLPKEDLTYCCLQLLKRYPAHRTYMVNGLISLCSSINFYVDQNETSPCNLVGPMNKYKQMRTPKEDIDKMITLIVNGFGDPDLFVREACIIFPILSDVECVKVPEFEMWLWLARFDEEQFISYEASRLWDLHFKGPCLNKNSLSLLLEKCINVNDNRLKSFLKAIANGLSHHSDMICDIVNNIMDKYVRLVPDHKKAVEESYWIEDDNEENKLEINTTIRFNIASIMNSCSTLFTEVAVQKKVFERLISSLAFSDPHLTVREEFINAALSIINNAEVENVKVISNVLEDNITKVILKSKEDSIYMREASDIMMAAIAINMKKPESVVYITKKLIDSLATHSKTAQITISGCLPKLVNLGGPKYRQETVDLLLNKIFSSTNVKEITGYAYGLANVLNGPNISYLIESGALERLKNALDKSKDGPKKQECSVITICAIVSTMGRLFEPFVADILPLMLENLSNANKDLHKIIKLTCADIISKFSAHCIKMSFPRLTAGLGDNSWKINVGIIEVMGNMAKIKPQYISSSLQLVIPYLIESLANSHPKVQEAAKLSLENFGKVVANPEMKRLSPTIVKCLADPNSTYDSALNELMEISFVHQIDASSLALLMPIIFKGLKAKSSSVKSNASIIIASVAQLTDLKHLITYLDDIRKELIELSLDPGPDVRIAAAKSLGMIVGKLGEDYFPTLIEELEIKLRKACDPADRSGIAQCLSYVLAAIGTEKLESIFYTVIKEVNSQDRDIRESFTTLLMYLISAFNQDFIPYVEKTTSIVIKGFFDEGSVYTQDISLRMGEIIIDTFIENSNVMNTFALNLVSALFSSQWKVRQNTLNLTKKLFSKIIGLSHNVFEDDNTKKSLVTAGKIIDTQHAITLIIVCYILRSDNTLSVRQTALTVLRLVVENVTSFVLHNVPTLSKVLIDCYVKYDKYAATIAYVSLKESVKNIGIRILDSLLNILTENATSGDAYTKRGTFFVIANSLEVAEQISVNASFYNKFIEIIEYGLLSRDTIIQDAAVRAFEPIICILGDRAIEELTLNLLSKVENYNVNGDKNSESTLDDIENNVISAFCSIMSLSINSVYDKFIEILKRPVITKFKVRALKAIIKTIDSFMEEQLSMTVDILLTLIDTAPEYRSDFSEALGTVLINVNMDVINSFFEYVENVFDGEDMEKKKICGFLMQYVLSNNTFNIYGVHTDNWVRLLLEITTRETDNELLDYVWKALPIALESIDKECSETYSIMFYEYLENARNNISPLFYEISTSIFLKGLNSKDQDIKLKSIRGLKFISQNSKTEAYEKLSTQIMGALIRLVVGKPKVEIKVEVFESMGLLLDINENFLNIFYPQIRRIIINSLFDPESEEVYKQAARCSLSLVVVKKRLDNFIHELIANTSKVTKNKILTDFNTTLIQIIDKIIYKKIFPERHTIDILNNYVSSIENTHGHELEIVKTLRNKVAMIPYEGSK